MPFFFKKGDESVYSKKDEKIQKTFDGGGSIW